MRELVLRVVSVRLYDSLLPPVVPALRDETFAMRRGSVKLTVILYSFINTARRGRVVNNEELDPTSTPYSLWYSPLHNAVISMTIIKIFLARKRGLRVQKNVQLSLKDPECSKRRGAFVHRIASRRVASRRITRDIRFIVAATWASKEIVLRFTGSDLAKSRKRIESGHSANYILRHCLISNITSCERLAQIVRDSEKEDCAPSDAALRIHRDAPRMVPPEGEERAKKPEALIKREAGGRSPAHFSIWRINARRLDNNSKVYRPRISSFQAMPIFATKLLGYSTLAGFMDLT
ncbi:hypothetical protein ALC53_11417 [Atta colombica]|uniref:Uncharacterized protein n=1 Tax=Atta colombica TaxID=520822 RepID=A0A195B1R3_9HYME|nr:hypothetical protein ALC53_11417 [Atta colombica]